jgi:predicted DNA-binding protein
MEEGSCYTMHMENIARSVRITADADSLLTTLAGKTGKPKAQIVQEALKVLEDRIFWSEVQTAFESGSEAASETELWDTTVADGFEHESR